MKGRIQDRGAYESENLEQAHGCEEDAEDHDCSWWTSRASAEIWKQKGA